ncbi:hypothetical protein IGI04_031191 [Brassica rapa subsp. trilocularis]|uniref:Uncharacterized protein n=1 Tax=Brassica rapa subsp. trilocularis TaxID=1813537 RepID=A0ABQ7LVK7_BRACM|nr:hypothetical protein IGI04_031191 [Brassica rapa subsp. trilocularis]
MPFKSAKSMGKATTFPYRTEPLTVSLPLRFSISGGILDVTIEKIQGGIDIRSILSKEDIFRSLPSNDYLEGYNEDIMFLEKSGWMVWKGMHTSQFLQQRTGIDDQTERGETLTPLLNMYKAQMQFCEDSKLMKIKRSMIPLVNTIFSEVTDSDYTRGVRSIRQLLNSVFLGLSSNARYQIINSLEHVLEGSTESKRIHVVAVAFKAGVRFSNNVYGGVQFVDWA